MNETTKLLVELASRGVSVMVSVDAHDNALRLSFSRKEPTTPARWISQNRLVSLSELRTATLDVLVPVLQHALEDFPCLA